MELLMRVVVSFLFFCKSVLCGTMTGGGDASGNP